MKRKRKDRENRKPTLSGHLKKGALAGAGTAGIYGYGLGGVDYIRRRKKLAAIGRKDVSRISSALGSYLNGGTEAGVVAPIAIAAGLSAGAGVYGVRKLLNRGKKKRRSKRRRFRR